MKRKMCKRKTNFCLFLFLIIGLCACSSKDEEIQNEAAALAKEHVYRFQEVKIPDLGGDEMAICASAYRMQTVSMLVKITNWANYNDNDIRILSFQEDGSEPTVFPLETLPWNPSAEDGPSEISTYENYTFGADGNIYALRSLSSETIQFPDEDTNAAIHYLCCWKSDGALLWETQLGDFPSDDGYVTVNAISVTAEGLTNLILTGGQAWQITVDAEGNPSAPKPLSDEIFRAFTDSTSVVHQSDGNLLLVCHGRDDWGEQYFISYAPTTNTLGEACRMPSCGWDGYGSISADAGSGILYSNRTGVFACSPGHTGNVEKMNFINSDFNISSFDALICMDDSCFAGLFYEGYGSEASMGIFTYVPPADVPDRTVITLAGVCISDSVIQRVVEFNRSSDKYRIAVRNMEEYDSDEELSAGIAEMTENILSGNMPDILVTDSLPTETFAARSLLADIGALIQADEELSQTDFLQNVFDAYSINGKLYYVIPSFEACTMIGALSTVGEGTSWTFDEAAQLLKTLPQGTNLIPEASRSSFLQTMMEYCGDSFLDAAAKNSGFQSQGFTDMLEYAGLLPEEPDADFLGEDYWRNFESQYREGRTILAHMRISSFDGSNYYVNGVFGEEASCIGFPMEHGAGSYIRAEESYAISAHSACMEGAWEFLRYYLTEEYQSSLETGLPVQKKVFLESSRQALQDTTCFINNEYVTLAPMNERQLNKLIDFILSINHRYFDNRDIQRIVYEETDSFFSGDKTAQEAAEIIRNRVHLYIDINLNQP